MLENDKLKEINDYIVNLNKTLYKDIYHIANPTLSRNPYMSKFLDYYLGYKDCKKLTILDKAKIILKYFFLFYIRYFIYIVKFFIFNIFRNKTFLNNQYDYIIEVNFLIKNLLNNKSYQDNYLKGLDKILEKNGYKVCYLVKSFIGYELNILNFFKVVQVLNKNSKSIISEFDLLTMTDLIKIFFLAHIYPFKLLAIKFPYKKLITKTLQISNVEALDSSIFTRFVRYRTGIKLAKKIRTTNIISQCEYKCHDKLFYKGIKDTNKNIFIYGCQLFIDYPIWLSTKVPKEEKQFNVTPDIVLVNGNADLEKHSIATKKGVSLRYNYLFNNKKIFNVGEEILILLAFEKNISKNILDVCINSKVLKNSNVIVRTHPVLDVKKFEGMIPKNWTIDSSTSLEQQFEKASIVIVSASGSAMEAVVKGKSVIIVGNKDTFTTNPLSNDLGKKVVWDDVYDCNELDKAIQQLLEVRKNNIDQVKYFAEKYLGMYFINPTEENILKCFTKEEKYK